MLCVLCHVACIIISVLSLQGPWSEDELFTLQSLWEPTEDLNTAIEQLLCSFPGLVAVFS